MVGARIGYTLATLGLSMAGACTLAAEEAASAHGPDAQGAAEVSAEPGSTGLPETLAQLYATVDEARVRRDPGVQTFETGAPSAVEPAAVSSDAGVRAPLPGRSARTVLHDEVNEAENLFFTDDGRLFVSATEDIYEITRAADGSFHKTDHFHEDCVVEGIVHSGGYLYGVCWTLQPDLSVRSFLLGGQLTRDPVFRRLGALEDGVVANGMTVDPEGRIYVTYTSGSGEIVRLTFAAPLQLAGKQVWARDLPNVNGIKYRDGAVYVTLLNDSLTSQFARVAVLPDGSAGKPEILYERWLTVLDDVLPFEAGFILSDFLNGTLIFWDPARGAYAETPARTFYGPTSLARGRPPLFAERQLIVAEKGNFLVRDERRGDLLSAYQLP